MTDMRKSKHKVSTRIVAAGGLNLDKVAMSLQTAGWQTSTVCRQRRLICSGVVRSSICVKIVYPMILDAMEDGIFAVATYPQKIQRASYGRICELLNARNYTARYGKFVMDSATGDLKFRVFRSSADVRSDFDKTISLLTSLPARMLDSIIDDIGSFVENANVSLIVESRERSRPLASKRCVRERNGKKS